MQDLIKQLVNYVIEAKIKDYRGDQSAETYRISRINKETVPGSDTKANNAAKFAKINADYKEEKRLEKAPRGPQTRVRPKIEEGAVVPAGAKTGAARLPTGVKPKANSGSVNPLGDRKIGNPFSKKDWSTRKAAIDKAIDG